MRVFLLSLVACAAVPPRPDGIGYDTKFTETTPLATVREIARRTLTPLTFEAGKDVLKDTQAVDLGKELFSVYVPAGEPPAAGWGLLVYVAPWEEPTRPKRWRPALDNHRVIFVAAAKSGNENSVLDRRLPLALLAWHNIDKRYRIDPQRTYIAGMSGGSRVAEIAALAYPDVFKGALLNAGSEPIGGENGVYIPPRDLFEQFQHSRIVFITGDADQLNLDYDQLSRSSLKHYCVFDVETLWAHRKGHEPFDGKELDQALAALDKRTPGGTTECNSRLQEEVREAAARARTPDELKALDARYSGLLYPEQP